MKVEECVKIGRKNPLFALGNNFVNSMKSAPV